MIDNAPFVANRFAMIDGGDAIDLATGTRVSVAVLPGAERDEQVRWARRCDAAHLQPEPGSPWLVDYGSLGPHRRFEAWSPAGVERAVLEPVALRAVGAIADLFADVVPERPRIVALTGARRWCTSVAVLSLARSARLAGLAPICCRCVTPSLESLTRGHTLFLIDADPAGGGWSTLMRVMLRSPRPHVLMFVREEEMPGVDCVLMDGPPARAAARRAEQTFGHKAAEAPVRYEASVEPLRVVPPQAPPAAGSDDLAALRRKADEARRLIAGGRHAPGERLLRQAIGGLSRRGDAGTAGEAVLDLAATLLRRGRPREARGLLDSARDTLSSRGAIDLLARAAALAGHAWIDLARLDEAEQVLAAGIAAARTNEFVQPLAELRMAMARCLFWKGRFADGDAAIKAAIGPGVPDELLTRAALARSRLAVGLRDYSGALTYASDALARASVAGDAALAGAAASAAAFAHLSVNDLDAASADAGRAVEAARTARAPLRGICARLLQAEAARRRGRRTQAALVLRRLGRLKSGRLPPIVTARVQLLAGLLKGEASARDVVVRQVAATGLAALRLLVPDAHTAAGELEAATGSVESLMAVLGLCQRAEEEEAVLGNVCARLRQDLRAAAVAVVSAGEEGSVLAGDGGRIVQDIARRAAAARLVITPHRIDDRIEAAAPISYGGEVRAAIVVRWTIGCGHDMTHAGTLLAIAALACAPAAAALLVRRAARAAGEPSEIIGISAAIVELRRSVARAAPAPFAVLIEGESGSGKELVARALHCGGPRRARAFCTLNCAALPDELVESELFGHARGAFTGAVGERPGVFEEAHGGTLFLDEVGELSPRAQAKVLRVIQEGELRRVGENVARRVDVRIVSATNRNLRDETRAGRFRLDLLYRLDVIRVSVAPLRDRREDIPVLAAHIWGDAARRLGSHATLGPDTMAALARYDWPGNVRELQNVLASLAVRTGKRGVVPASALPAHFSAAQPSPAWRLGEARRTFEEQFVRAALVRSGGRRAQAASELGVTRQGLTKLMTRLGITS